MHSKPLFHISLYLQVGAHEDARRNIQHSACDILNNTTDVVVDGTVPCVPQVHMFILSYLFFQMVLELYVISRTSF